MRLTPLDIRKQEFNKSFRGFDTEEVFAFLQMVSNQWQELLDDNRRLEERLKEYELKLKHYSKVEEALEQALQTARESSRQAIENAERKAKALLEEAEQRANELRREAEDDRHQIKREVSKIGGRRTEIVARLRAFLMSEMELLAHYEGDDPVGFIKLLPGEQVDRGERYLAQSEPVDNERPEASIFTEEPVDEEPSHEEDPELANLADEISALSGSDDVYAELNELNQDSDVGQEDVAGPGVGFEETEPARFDQPAPWDNESDQREDILDEHEDVPEQARHPFTAVGDLEEEEPVAATFDDGVDRQAETETDDLVPESDSERTGWVVRSFVTPDDTTDELSEDERPVDDADVPVDDIAKIRRILDDLD